MSGYVYETHIVDTLLPFIFHVATTVRAQNGCRPNWHSNLELLCCISGEGEVKLNSESCYMHPGDVVVINSNVIHSTCTQGHFVYHCLIVDNSFCRANGLDMEHLQFQQFIQDEDLTAAFLRLAENYSHGQPNRDLHRILEIRHDILGILCTLYGKYQFVDDRKENFQATQRVKDVVTYIRQNLASAMPLEQLAELVDVSKFHLSREFKANTGLTVVEFINLCRCTEAKRLIEEGTSVSEAAMVCGFENLSYFTRTFKKHFAVLPSSLQSKNESRKDEIKWTENGAESCF